MKVGFVFHKDPWLQPDGIDTIRLHALTGGLRKRGLAVEIVAPVERRSVSAAGVPVHPLEHLGEAGYDVVKTCYHFSIELIGAFGGPVVSRIVRVVDEKAPERDAAWRDRLMRCQDAIAARARVVVFNNRENEQRWRAVYGAKAATMLVPTGCPSVIPRTGASPYEEGEQVVLFLGSLCAPRMVPMLNRLAEALRGVACIHHIGRDKLHLYDDGRAEGKAEELAPLVVRHGELPEERIWGYIGHARIGLALAPGPYPFDNDLAKIYSYLRGGLPVLAEERIVNNDLLRATGNGGVFAYDDVDDAAARALLLLERPPGAARQRVMDFMAHEHSWEQRVDRYYRLLTCLQAGGQGPQPH